MPPVSRLGDQAFCPSDAHGCPACPHPVIGPAVTASANVLVDGLPVLRVTDQGIHAACCGPNSWVAVQGSTGVFVNGLPVVRLGDQTQHCGGIGALIQGSSTVMVGDTGTATARITMILEAIKQAIAMMPSANDRIASWAADQLAAYNSGDEKYATKDGVYLCNIFVHDAYSSAGRNLEIDPSASVNPKSWGPFYTRPPVAEELADPNLLTDQLTASTDPASASIGSIVAWPPPPGHDSGHSAIITGGNAIDGWEVTYAGSAEGVASNTVEYVSNGLKTTPVYRSWK